MPFILWDPGNPGGIACPMGSLPARAIFSAPGISLRMRGRLKVPTLVMIITKVGTFNLPRILKEMPGALKMARAGKLPIGQAIPPGFPGSHKMKGMDRVRNVVRKAASLKPKKPEVTG